MNATTHEFLPEEVMAFLDGELPPERAAAIATHLEACPECSAVASNLRSLSGQMSSWHVAQFPASLGAGASAPKLEKYEGRRANVVSKWRPSTPLRWLVIAGSAVSALVLLMLVANLMRSRMAANESSAVGSLRTLNTAAATYLDSYGHYPPSLKSLGPSASGKASAEAADLVDPLLAGGRKSGYLFTYHFYLAFGATHAGTYTIQADPLDPGSSSFRHFSTDQTGVLFANGVALDGYIRAERAQTSSDASKVLQAGDVPTEAAPMIVRSAVLKLEVEKIREVREKLEQILAQHKGYIAQLSATGEGSSEQTLVASLRVPADQLNECISEMKKLGRVVEETITGEEVTSQHRDLAARLENARATESKLNDLIRQRTGKVSDILEVEKESARVRGEIDQMEAEQKTLEHRVDFATIDLKLAEEYKAQLNTPAPSVAMQLRNASINGFRNAFESLLAPGSFSR